MSIAVMLGILAFVWILLLLAVGLCRAAAMADVKEDTGEYED